MALSIVHANYLFGVLASILSPPFVFGLATSKWVVFSPKYANSICEASQIGKHCLVCYAKNRFTENPHFHFLYRLLASVAAKYFSQGEIVELLQALQFLQTEALKTQSCEGLEVKTASLPSRIHTHSGIKCVPLSPKISQGRSLINKGSSKARDHGLYTLSQSTHHPRAVSVR
jgi:hypothetical protein